ncbi:hypothetical protein CYMTET_55979 [Cymbomonas tetramitiformis]|uniref:Uncharacterized protein n=1 Tax=Cymbomonas tetramitiformis TaxID=36881 RepID=A0AAE0BD59_9CHLO|nr:hypothetical protein CYMTET_55979 [Cymbomonas tetramitiformis]
MCDVGLVMEGWLDWRSLGAGMSRFQAQGGSALAGVGPAMAGMGEALRERHPSGGEMYRQVSARYGDPTGGRVGEAYEPEGRRWAGADGSPEREGGGLLETSRDGGEGRANGVLGLDHTGLLGSGVLGGGPGEQTRLDGTFSAEPPRRIGASAICGKTYAMGGGSGGRGDPRAEEQAQGQHGVAGLVGDPEGLGEAGWAWLRGLSVDECAVSDFPSLMVPKKLWGLFIECVMVALRRMRVIKERCAGFTRGEWEGLNAEAVGD